MRKPSVSSTPPLSKASIPITPESTKIDVEQLHLCEQYVSYKP